MPTEGANSISDLTQGTPTSAAPAGEGDDELRQLKSVLKASFPALDGLINNTGATGDPNDTDPPNATTFSKLFTDVRGLREGEAVPVGAIVMWDADVSTRPTGWAVCDGTLGTPDLSSSLPIPSIQFQGA